jgi:micrococcal nuclease
MWGAGDIHEKEKEKEKENRSYHHDRSRRLFRNFFWPIIRGKSVEGILLQVAENQVSEVPATLVTIIDGDTIKVMVNGKIETVRYLLIDTPESKSPKTCVQKYAKEAFVRNSDLVKCGKLT